MFHFFGTATNTRGDSLSNWQVEVVQFDDGETVVPIYLDESRTAISTVSGIANRAKTDARGNYDFWIDSGQYSLRFYDDAGVFQRLQRGLQMYGDVDNDTAANVTAAQAAQAAAETARTGAELAQANAEAATEYSVGVARDTLTNLNALSGPFSEGDSAAVYVDDTTSNNGIYSYTSSAWVKVTDLPEVSAALSAAASAASATEATAFAQIAAAFSGPLYATIADGLAGTLDGKEFAVVNGDGTASIYYNNAGSEIFQRTIIIDPQASTAATNIGFSDTHKNTVSLALEDRVRYRDVAISSRERRLEIIAHRGFADQFPENTLPAFSLALKSGADGLEIDGQPSSDGALYAFHDDAVDSLTDGTGTFTQLSSSTIDGLSFTELAGTPLSDTSIPRLSDVLAFARQAGVFVYLEIKNYRTQSDIDLFVQEVVDAGMEELTLLCSFTYSDIEYVRNINNTIEVGWLTNSTGYTTVVRPAIDSLTSLGKASLVWNYQRIQASPNVVGYCSERGVGLVTWTVNTDTEAAQMKRLGVNRIITDVSLRRADK